MQPVLKIQNLNVWYGSRQVLFDVNLTIYENTVTAIMGPSGCGKSTLIRCINRMHELVEGAKVAGKILLRLNNKWHDVYSMNPIEVRKMIGMVFQQPNPFPTMSIYENVLAGYIINGIKLTRVQADRIVRQSLEMAALWSEVKDSLHRRGTFLSGGQQQRLCIARALAMNPRLLLLDEPTSALDPRATARIEQLICSLKQRVTILLVTHNISQAARVADYTAFLYEGKVVEFGSTKQIFTVPKHKLTEQYLSGKFG